MKEALKYASSILVVLFVWWLLSFLVGTFVSGHRGSILPGPAAAVQAIRDNFTLLSRHFVASAYRLCLGLFISLVVGASIGLVVGYEDFLDSLVSPILYLLYPIPKVVFLPMILVLLGLSDFARVFFVALVVVFQILLATRDAAKNLSEEWVSVVRSFQGSKFQIYRHVVLPATLPAILSSLRISVGIGVAALYLAETSYANSGLGYYISSTWKVFAYADVFSGIVALAFLGLVLYWIIDFVERLACEWQFV